jgi:hemerythrin-like domain-containing protein
MIEHRLIERMIALMGAELTRIKDNVAVDPEFAFVDPFFLDMAVDFIRTYADRCHHGKEEDILFAALTGKELSPVHRQTMEELVQEHVWARETTARLVQARRATSWKPGALGELFASTWSQLVEFYPRHIDKEDQNFFIPCMAYCSGAEKARCCRMMAFDQKQIHESTAWWKG